RHSRLPLGAPDCRTDDTRGTYPQERPQARGVPRRWRRIIRVHSSAPVTSLTKNRRDNRGNSSLFWQIFRLSIEQAPQRIGNTEKRADSKAGALESKVPQKDHGISV